MNRRDFLGTSALFTAATMTPAFADSEVQEATQKAPEGAVTLYYEFKIAGPEIKKMIQNISLEAKRLKNIGGFLSLSLKLMIGDSTMVNNFLPDTGLKGVLKSAYIDAAMAKRRPFVYTLFIRFASYKDLLASDSKAWFKKHIVPQLFAYNPASKPPKKMPLALEYYQGIYQTVSAGDAHGVYVTQKEIKNFLKRQKDISAFSYQTIPTDGTSGGVTVTVQNHVSFYDKDVFKVNKLATKLLGVAQKTYQPSQRRDDGLPGHLSNSYYQKALTTEILQNAYVLGGQRDYLFHGVWRSVADHENSHADKRFMKAAAPVGAMAVSGPFEPFYQTIILEQL